ncbi:MAG: hypothetical protein M9924_07065 [Rhizobiaceae bacterium]|nr:hypothetical protein [Rhizobiaceae bacterium]
MPDPIQRLRDRTSFASDSVMTSIERASTMARPVFASPTTPESEGNEFRALFQPALHEAYAAPADHAALIGFGLGVLRSLRQGPLLWVRQAFLDGETGGVYPSGLREYGIDPDRLILVQASHARDLLQAGLEAARCKALAGAMLELNGETSLYDLTASRRLMLAARASGVRLFFLRSAASPVPSAAETRWRVRSLASAPLAANAPGQPAFEAELLRSRRGAESKTFVLEWNPDAGEFEKRRTGAAGTGNAGPSRDRAEALSGSVVSFPVHGQAAPGGRRRAG